MKTKFRIAVAVALLSWAGLSAAGSQDTNDYASYLIAQVQKAKDFEKVARARGLENLFASLDAAQLESISADNIDRLAKLLGDDEPVVQEVAAAALKRVGKHAARALPALQCARSPEPPTPLMQQVINDIKAQTGAEDGIQWVPSSHGAEAAAWNSLSFCSSTGYCVNVAESDQHRIGRLEIKFQGQDVPLSDVSLDAIQHPLLNEIHLVSLGNNGGQRLDIPFQQGDATGKVFSLTLDQGRVVSSATRAD